MGPLHLVTALNEEIGLSYCFRTFGMYKTLILLPPSFSVSFPVSSPICFLNPAPEGIARGPDALSLLETPETRNQFIDELMEVTRSHNTDFREIF